MIITDDNLTAITVVEVYPTATEAGGRLQDFKAHHLAEELTEAGSELFKNFTTRNGDMMSFYSL